MRRFTAVLAAVALVTAALLAVPGLAGQHQDRGNQTDGQDGQTQADGQGGQNRTDGQNRTGGQGGQADRQGGPDQRPNRTMSPEDRRQWAQQKRQQAFDRAERAGLFGQLTYEDGRINGTFVEAELDNETGTVSDHTLVRNNTSATVVASFAPDGVVDGEVQTRPSTATLGFEDGELRLQDNPTGLVQYRSTAPANVSIEIADGYNVTLAENETKARITGDVNASVILTANGSLEADGQTLEATLADAGAVLFQAQPDEPGQQVSQRALELAAQQDRLGGEVRVSGAAGEPVDQSTPVDVNLTAQYAGEGQAIVEVDGDVDEGRVVNLKIAKANLPVNGTDEVEPELDNETIEQVDSIDEVVNATGQQPVAHVTVQQRVVEVTVWVPEFSLHSVSVEDTTQDVQDHPDPLSSDNPTGATVPLAQQARERAIAQAEQWSQLSADVQAEATANAEQAGLFGQANLSGGTLQGSNVQADVDADTGTLQDYRLAEGGTTLFEEVRPTSFTPAADAQQLGSAVALAGEEVAITAHDTPTAHLEIEAGNSATTVELQTPTSAEIDRVNQERITVTTPDGVEAHVSLVAGDGELIVEGDTIVANLGANAAVHALAEPGQQVPSKANLEQRVQAAARGDLGAEAAITAVDGTPVADHTETSVELTTQEVDQAAGEVTVQASSQVPDPRAVTLNLDPAVVDQASAEDLTVLLDGQEIEAAADAQAALDATDARGSYHAEQAGDALQVIVNVDGFSDHDITVQSSDDTQDDGTSDTNDTTEDTGTDGQEEAPFPSAVAVLAALGTLAVVLRRR